MKIISIILGITHNKPDINPKLSTTISIIIVIERIKIIIRIELKLMKGNSISIRIIKPLTTETSLIIRIMIITLIRNGIETIKSCLMHSTTQFKIFEHDLNASIQHK